MQHRLFPRAVSFCCAALVTLAMLGGIDQLSLHEASTAVWAHVQHGLTQA